MTDTPLGHRCQSAAHGGHTAATETQRQRNNTAVVPRQYKGTTDAQRRHSSNTAAQQHSRDTRVVPKTICTHHRVREATQRQIDQTDATAAIQEQSDIEKVPKMIQTPPKQQRQQCDTQMPYQQKRGIATQHQRIVVPKTLQTPQLHSGVPAACRHQIHVPPQDRPKTETCKRHRVITAAGPRAMATAPQRTTRATQHRHNRAPRPPAAHRGTGV